MQSAPAPFVIREVKSASEPAFFRAMELYVETFPRDEREPIEYFAQCLAPTSAEREIWAVRHRLLVAELEDKTVCGMRFFSFSPEARLGFLVYLVAEPRFRSIGVGSRLIESAVALCKADAVQCGIPLDGVIFEVERVDLAETPEDRQCRSNRIAFFQTREAEIITPTYVQPALSADKEPVPLNLFAYALNPNANRRDVVKRFYKHFLGVDESNPMVSAAIDGCN